MLLPGGSVAEEEEEEEEEEKPQQRMMTSRDGERENVSYMYAYTRGQGSRAMGDIAQHDGEWHWVWVAQRDDDANWRTHKPDEEGAGQVCM